MRIIDRFLEFLKKPFPDEYFRSGYLKVILAFSLFVTFFLYIFQPFGIADIESNKFFICLGFGSMTFFGALIYEMTVGQLLKIIGFRNHWTFGKWILYNLGVMFFISFFNFLFIRLVFFGYILWELFPAMVYGTFMIGIISIVVIGAISLMKQEDKYQNIAKEINQKKSDIANSKSSDEQSIFNIPIVQIKYIEAFQNYIKIGFTDQDGALQEKVERATIKQMIKDTEGTSLVRCHRSFVVNQAAIESTSGNAQGLVLSLSNCDKTIPVSRSYVSLFR